MDEIEGSHFSAYEPEKGLHNAQDGTHDAAHLSDVHDGTERLPPMDGGMEAWFFLAACFVMEALVWGFAFSYGIFQAYYTEMDIFKSSGNIAVIGTCAMVRTINI